MKAKKNFYWEGRLIKSGEEAPEGVPLSLVSGGPQKEHQITSKKVTTKSRKPKRETKNAAPKTEDK